MDTKFNLLKAANAQLMEQRNEIIAINTNLATLAESADVTVEVMVESVTHILANIAQTAAAGKPIKLMHLNSVAAFMAGVAAIAQGLPDSKDQVKKSNTIRMLAHASIAADGQINDATFPIIDLGARKEDLKAKYAQMLQAYMANLGRSKGEGQELSGEARRLQMSIDRAMRTQTRPQSFARTGGAPGEVATQAM